MLDTLKLKLKELAELRRDIDAVDEYIAERRIEYEMTDSYKSYKKAAGARDDLLTEYGKLAEEIACIIDSLYALTNEGSDLSQYLE